MASEIFDFRDTVASVGVIAGRTLPFVDVNTTIRVFRQALSLDEVCTKALDSLSSLGAIRPYTSHALCGWPHGCHPLSRVLHSAADNLLLTAPRQVSTKLVSPFGSWSSSAKGRGGPRPRCGSAWDRWSIRDRCEGGVVRWVSFRCGIELSRLLVVG
jgi:hypothetical protein